MKHQELLDYISNRLSSLSFTSETVYGKYGEETVYYSNDSDPSYVIQEILEEIEKFQENENSEIKG